MRVDEPVTAVEVQDIIATLGSLKVEARSRLAQPALWDEVGQKLSYWPVDYSQAMMNYQVAYFSDDGRLAKDASLILFHDKRPAGLWPLMIVKQTDGSRRICSNGGPVLPPLFASTLMAKTVKGLTRACVEALQSVWQSFAQREQACIDCFSATIGLGDWHEQLMLRSARLSVQHQLYVDLQRPLAEVRTGFRKSFKPLISQGLKLWDASVVSVPDEGQWDEFRRLHIAVAGRVTRSDESWRWQLAAVSSGDAFFVVLRDAQSAMVGAALFHVTRDEGLYAVGAYDRSLFEKPLGHVVQFLAVEEMSRRAVNWYRLGSRAYLTDQPVPSTKEMTISDFKQGFSSHLMPRFRYEFTEG